MSLEKLRQELSAETSGQVKSILSEARATGKSLLKEARVKAAENLEQARDNALKEAELLEFELSAARLEAKRVFAEVHNELVAEVFQELRGQLAEFTKKREYPVFLKKLALHAAKELGAKPGDVVFFVNKRDYLVLSKEFKNVSREPIDCIGGVVAEQKDGKIKMNNTLEALLEEKEELVRRTVLEQLPDYDEGRKTKKRR